MLSAIFAVFVMFSVTRSAVGTVDEDVNPTFKLRITQPGLDYANRVASNILNDEIRRLRLSNVEHNGTKATNIRVTSFRAPAYSYSLSPPSTLSWGFSGADIELAARVHACKRVLVNICKDLDVIAGASDVTIRIAAKFGSSANVTGQPKIVGAECHASIGRLDLRIRGGLVGWIMNIFRRGVARKMKPKIEKALCRQGRNFMLNKVNAKLASFPVQTQVGRLFNIDYGLVSELMVTSDHIEIALKGQVSQIASPDSVSPYEHTPIAMTVSKTRMVYAWASDKIVNDILYLAHVTNLTQMLLTEETPMLGPFLKLRCPNSTKKCLGSRMTELQDMFPSSIESAKAFLSTSSPPCVRINGNGTASLSIKGTMDLYVSAPNSTNQTEVKLSIAFSEITMEAHLRVEVKNMSLVGQISVTDLKIHVLESKLDFFTVMMLEGALPGSLSKKIENVVNTRFGIGVPIPVTTGITLINPQIRLLERTVQVESDAVYVR